MVYPQYARTISLPQSEEIKIKDITFIINLHYEEDKPTALDKIIELLEREVSATKTIDIM